VWSRFARRAIPWVLWRQRRSHDESFEDQVPPPKFLKGKVVGNTYYAAEGQFQIDLPHPASGKNEETYEWLHGQAKDVQTGR